MKRMSWILNCCAALGVLCASAVNVSAADAAAASAPLAEPQEAYAAYDIDWVDAQRQRKVPVRLYLPRQASAEHPVPMVLFSHGIGGSRRGYSYLGSYWASHGVASLHVEHVGSARDTVWSGNPFNVAARLREAAKESEAIARVHDLHFALDHVLAADGPFAARIDAGRIVAAGHSYGANTTLLAAGARIERSGQRLDFRDPRIKAAIVMSAPPFYGETDVARILGGVVVPSLHITATEDVIRVPGYYSAASDRIAVFEAIGGPRKLLAVFEGGSHSIFTDRSGTGGAALNAQVKRATSELSLAFLKSVFDGDELPPQRWPGQFGDIVSRFVSGGS
jgi:predicted dienelactone hydrolase